jgi:hypothetical protein
VNARPPAIAIFAAVVIVVIGDAVATVAFKSSRGPSIAVQGAILAFLASEISLLACWLAFGNQSLPIRLLWVVPGCVLIFFPLFIEGGPLHEEFVAFAVCNLIVVGVATLPLLLRACGARIVRLDPANVFVPAASDHNSLQFTLRQMFGWTLSAAIVAALIRFVVPPETQLAAAARIVGAIATFATASAAVCGAVWAALGRGKPLRRIPVVAVVCAGVTLIICAAFHASSDEMWGTSVIVALEVALTACALLLWRSAGFRLIRAGRNVRAPEERVQLKN